MYSARTRRIAKKRPCIAFTAFCAPATSSNLMYTSPYCYNQKFSRQIVVSRIHTDTERDKEEKEGKNDLVRLGSVGNLEHDGVKWCKKLFWVRTNDDLSTKMWLRTPKFSASSATSRAISLSKSGLVSVDGSKRFFRQMQFEGVPGSGSELLSTTGTAACAIFCCMDSALRLPLLSCWL